MPGRLNVANLQGLAPDFKVELVHDSTIEIEGDLRLQNQSYMPVPGGPDNEKPVNPKYGSLWMNTWTGRLEYWKGPAKGGWNYITPGGSGGGGGGTTEEPAPVITSIDQWDTMAVIDTPHLVQASDGSQEPVTPVALQTQQGAKVALHLGDMSVGGTSWPGNNQSQQWNRTIDATVVANFQKFGYIFSAQRLAVTGVSGQSEACCDPYRYENMFGSTFTGDWTWIYGAASASAHQPYEITLNTFTQSQTASNNLYLRHQTDGSVNSGPGFYTHTAGFYLYKAN
tara:strand:+ start:1038 stop:1886 length:849 start_codon:yes stop_codon:yes gene_type:complete